MRMVTISLVMAALLAVSWHLKATEESRSDYLELIRYHPNLVKNAGNADKGEIEIIRDQAGMAAVEKKMKRNVGVIAIDNYWIWINDACLFPSKRQGVYGRILPIDALDSPRRVMIMPVTSEGKIILNCNFRHATRSWEIELPRGSVNAGESFEEAAKRQTLEETGMVLSNLTKMGDIPPYSSVVGVITPVFAGEVIGESHVSQEYSEAIEKILCLTIDEIKQAFARGYYECKIKEEDRRIPFRDPFLAYALMIYEIQKHGW